jgi:hypothetical protein
MVEKTRYPTRNGTVELQTRFNSGGMRVLSGDGSLFVSVDHVDIKPWKTQDGWSTVGLWKGDELVSKLDMKSHVARRFGVECAHEFIDVDF